MIEPTLDVTVVIPTYNRCEALLRTLDALARVEYPADRWEVVVDDDGSIDRTKVSVDGWVKRSGAAVGFWIMRRGRGRLNIAYFLRLPGFFTIFHLVHHVEPRYTFPARPIILLFSGVHLSYLLNIKILYNKYRSSGARLANGFDKGDIS